VILRAIGVLALLRIQRLPFEVPRGNSGMVALCLTSLKIGDAGVASFCDAMRCVAPLCLSLLLSRMRSDIDAKRRSTRGRMDWQ
jgi:hypothetical protein